MPSLMEERGMEEENKTVGLSTIKEHVLMSKDMVARDQRRFLGYKF